jgi:hypothetical protein
LVFCPEKLCAASSPHHTPPIAEFLSCPLLKSSGFRQPLPTAFIRILFFYNIAQKNFAPQAAQPHTAYF